MAKKGTKNCFKTNFQSVFEQNNSILHRFTFLDNQQRAILVGPKTRFLTSKTHFSQNILHKTYIKINPSTCLQPLHDMKIYAFKLVICTIFVCVLLHFTLHLAPFSLAFS